MTFDVFRPSLFDAGDIVRCVYPTTGLALGRYYLVAAKRKETWALMPYDVVEIDDGNDEHLAGIFAARFEPADGPE